MAFAKRIERMAQKMDRGKLLRKNRVKRAYGMEVWKEFTEHELRKIGKRYGAGNYRGPSLGAAMVSEAYARRRGGSQEMLNSSRGKGKNSAWKLTGIGHSMDFDASVQREIAKKGGRAAAEARILRKWLKRPEVRRKEMDEWLKKYGKRK